MEHRRARFIQRSRVAFLGCKLEPGRWEQIHPIAPALLKDVDYRGVGDFFIEGS
jgi:hypothetical protein